MNKQTHSNHDIVYSPADRGTKKHVYLPYRGAISFWFYLVPLRLVSIFLVPNALFVELLQNCITVKKVIFQVQFQKK